MGHFSMKKVGDIYIMGDRILAHLFVVAGQFLHDHLIPARKLEVAAPSLEEERQSFLSFIRCMLAWLPEERKDARELMEHPFLNLGDG